MVWAAIWASRRSCVAGELSVRFRRPAAPGVPLAVVASVVRSKARLVETASDDDRPGRRAVATATGKYLAGSADETAAFFGTVLVEPASAAAVATSAGVRGRSAIRLSGRLAGRGTPPLQCRMSDTPLDAVLATIDQRRDASLAQLNEFLSIPSVSTQPAHKGDMLKCAAWLSDHLREAGFAVRVEATPGHPIVLAKNEHRPGRPTVLVYGHYDVQPPEPLELWTSPPFEPTVRQTATGADAVYARGAVDDKGQVWAHVEALTAWQAHGGLPVNVTLLIEGEEEIGSEHLEAFVRAPRPSWRPTWPSSATRTSSPTGCRPSPTACGACATPR